MLGAAEIPPTAAVGVAAIASAAVMPTAKIPLCTIPPVSLGQQVPVIETPHSEPSHAGPVVAQPLALAGLRAHVGHIRWRTTARRRCHTGGVTGDGRLNALEAGFLWMETDVQPLHVGSLLIFEGPAPDHHELCDRIATRLAPAPWHRRRAQRMPLDLGRPIWVDSELFAVAEHLHHAVLDPPGDDAQLRAMVLWIMAERLDAGRPMWEMWQVDGLSGGRWAVIAKAHHAMVDGRSGTDVVQSVLDLELTGTGACVQPLAGALRPAPSRGALVASGATWLLSLPFRLIGRFSEPCCHRARRGVRSSGCGLGWPPWCARTCRPASSTGA